jgi:undecaprenyl diphosphate synthase
LVVAFNYGARQEIARAAARIAAEVAAGTIQPAAITADLIARHLDAPDLPDPDLLIRTSGEQRLSNFLLWQAAYSELVFVPIYWPDFDRAALEGAIAEYRRRERRFGGLAARTGS